MMLLLVFLTFFKIGAFTFGGGYAMLPLIEDEISSKGWMELRQLVDFIAVSESTPGPFAINISTYIGSELGGFFGAVCATLGVALPSFIIILIIARFFNAFGERYYVKGCMNGLRPAVVGMIASALCSVGMSVFFPDGINVGALASPTFTLSACIFIAMLLLELKKANPIIIIIISAAVGIAAGYAFGF